MAQQAPLSSPSLQVLNLVRILRLLLLHATLAATTAAQAPQQQYVFGSAPLTPATSQVAAYIKNGATGALSAVPGSPFADSQPGGAMAIDALGRFLFVANTSTSNISMFQIDQSTGNLVEVPGSPFSSGPTENPSMAPTLPVCLAVEKSGQFLYVGRVTVGQSSNSQLVTLTNTGGQALSLTSFKVSGANPSDFVATPNCSLPAVLAPNISCVVSVVFSPTAAGMRQASLAATDNAPGSPQSILLVGTGVSAQPAVTLSPGSLTFATTAQGSTSPAQSVTLTNSGTAALHISSVLPSGANPADFQLTNACSGAYPVAATCNITVTFSPLGAGQRIANIAISDDAPGSPQSVQLTGTGAAAPPGTPVVKLTPNSVSFGAVTQGAPVAVQMITLTNSGTGPLHITSVALGGTNSSDFGLTNSCTAAAYAPGTTCGVGISFSPIATGARAAFITIADDAPSSPQTVALSATVNPAFAISPAAAGSTSVTVTAGQTAAFNLQLTPGPGFTGSASFACAGAPAAAACSAPSVQFSAGIPIAYVVNVTTTASTLAPPSPPAQRLPPFVWLYLFSLVACGAVLVLYAYHARRWKVKRGLLRTAAIAIIVSCCIFQAAGCGGGGGVSPQAVPTPHTTGTPTGTSIITITPSVTTSTGTPLLGVPPIQLTLIVK